MGDGWQIVFQSKKKAFHVNSSWIYLRQSFLPRAVLLICNVLTSTKRFEKCLELTNVMAIKQHLLRLHKVSEIMSNFSLVSWLHLFLFKFDNQVLFWR